MNEKEMQETLIQINSAMNNIYSYTDTFFNNLISKLEAKGKECSIIILEEDETHGPDRYDNCPLYDWYIERILTVDGHDFYIYDWDYENDQFFNIISKTELVKKIQEKDPTYETDVWKFPSPAHEPADYIWEENNTHKLSVDETIEYILNDISKK